jgi:hypothetical protein
MNNMQHIVSLAEEPPTVAPASGTYWIKLPLFIAGNLAFFHGIRNRKYVNNLVLMVQTEQEPVESQRIPKRVTLDTTTDQ